MQTCGAAVCLGLALLCHTSPAAAFAEDLCPKNGGGWQQCSYEPCHPDQQNLACGSIAMMTTFESQSVRGVGARSVLHFDATYYLAQAAGFSPRDAYYVAAYDEASDLKQYIHLDQQGHLPIDPGACAGDNQPAACRLYSRVIGGIDRNNFIGGGVFFHFMAPPQGANASDWMNPAVDDPATEPFLYRTRRWVYDEGPLCIGGLVATSADGNADGTHCFESGTRTPPSLVGEMPFISQLGYLTELDWVADIGEQAVASDPATSTPEPASQMPLFIPPQDVPLVRLGIFLHALADRVSHHRCVDASYVQGPRPADAQTLLLNPLPYPVYELLINIKSLQQGLPPLLATPLTYNPDYRFHFDRSECDQPDHALRHTLETGHDQGTLDPQDRTVAPALSAVLLQLQQFAQFHRFPAAAQLDLQQRQALVDELLTAVATADAQQRIDAVTAVAAHHGWLPLPLYDGLSQSAWEARAGAAYFAGNGTPPAGGGAAMPAVLLALAVVLRWRRRK